MNTYRVHSSAHKSELLVVFVCCLAHLKKAMLTSRSTQTHTQRNSEKLPFNCYCCCCCCCVHALANDPRRSAKSTLAKSLAKKARESCLLVTLLNNFELAQGKTINDLVVQLKIPMRPFSITLFC